MLISDLTTEMMEEGLKLLPDADSIAFAFCDGEIAVDTETTLFTREEVQSELLRRSNASIHTSNPSTGIRE